MSHTNTNPPSRAGPTPGHLGSSITPLTPSSSSPHTHISHSPPPHTHLSILSLNCARSTTVMHTILEIAKQRSADIVLLQEPWIHRTNSTVSHPSFTAILPPPHTLGTNRVCAFISKGRTDLTVSHKTELSTSRDLQVLEVTTGVTSTTTVYNIYNGKTTATPDIRVLEEPWSLNINSPRTIITGDFNAHHPIWNTSKRPLRASRVIHLIDEQKFELLNTQNTPTFFNGRSESVIDLTLVSEDLHDKIRNWAVLDETTGSDHMAISIDIHEDHPASPSDTPFRFNSKKTDWKLFDKFLTNNRDHTMNILKGLVSDNQGADKAAHIVQSLLLSAINESTPLSKPSPQSKRWWNQSISDNRCILHHRRREWKSNKTIENWESYCSQRNLYNRTIREAKKQTWMDYLETVKGTDTFKVFNMLKPSRQIRTPTLEDKDGVHYSTFQDKARLFTDTLFPPTPPNTTRSFIYPPKQKLPWESLNSTEVKEAITSFNPTKAPGPDGISFLYIQRAYETIPEPFNKAYDIITHSGHHPTLWRNSLTVVIPKPNKPDYKKARAYRPVALLPCLSKVLEKIVATRLGIICEKFQLLHNTQMGGRRQRSAMDAVSCLVHDVETAKRNKKTTTALFLDIKGAYDNVSHSALIQTLTHMGFPPTLTKWVQSFTSDRETTMTFDGERTRPSKIGTGVPQGSPVSPILFLIYLQPMFEMLDAKHPDIDLLSYADDVKISFSSSSVEENITKLTTTTHTLYTWAEENGLEFDDSKTELIHFTPRANITTITLPNETIISPSQEVKWLGVWFDNRLSYNTHRRLRQISGNTMTNMLNHRDMRTLPLQQTRHIYISAILPTMLWGAEAWWKNSDTQLHSFIITQNKALRNITGGWRTSPIRALECESAIPPLQVKLNFMTNRFVIRALSLHPNHPLRQRLPYDAPRAQGQEECFDQLDIPNTTRGWTSQSPRPYHTHLDRILSRLKTIIFPSDEIESTDPGLQLPWEIPPLTTLISPLSKRLAANEHAQLLPALRKQSLIIYTDGSQRDNLTAGAYCSDDHTMKNTISFGEMKEVFDAELLAINLAMQDVCSLEAILPSTLTIFSDSQASIQRCRHLQPSAGQSTVFSIWNYARQLCQRGVKTTISWVPGHEGIEGNEQADKLAGQATTHPIDEQYISITKLKRLVRHRAIEEWQQQFLSTDKGTEYTGHPTLSLKPELQMESRAITTPLIHLRTGHGYFKAYFERFKRPLGNYICSCGSTEQTRTHLLLHCPTYHHTRQKLFSSDPANPWTTHTLLHTQIGICKVKEFIEETKIATRGWFGKMHREDEEPANWSTLTIGLGRLNIEHDQDTDPVTPTEPSVNTPGTSAAGDAVGD
jgi:ribonuclease HI/exonuclease III